VFRRRRSPANGGFAAPKRSGGGWQVTHDGCAPVIRRLPLVVALWGTTGARTVSIIDSVRALKFLNNNFFSASRAMTAAQIKAP
jgi:hypothetical protein